MLRNPRFVVRGFAAALLAACVVALGCAAPATDPTAADSSAVALTAGRAARPVLATYADSLAMRVYEASGGPDAWEALPYLRFNFYVSREGMPVRAIKHLWSRRTGDYRIERRGPGATPYVILFNVNTRQGSAYWQGTALDSTTQAEQLTDAYRRFINDTYWLLVPFKLFDPGVHRAYVPDSSDADYDVLHLSFGDVGLTPGDQYWLYVDKVTERLARWTYKLEGDAPDAAPRSFVWEGYEAHPSPGGTLHFATHKRSLGDPFAIVTDHIETPATVSPDAFSDPQPRFGEQEIEEDQ